MSASKNDIVKNLKSWLIHNSINDVTVKDLDEIGIDTSKSNQVIGNVEISNSFIWGPKIKVIDPKKDLEGNLLSKNKDLLQKIKNTTYNGKYEINFKTTGFDRNPLTSLVIEATKKSYVNKESANEIFNNSLLNYNRYSLSLLTSQEFTTRLDKLKILYS